jgi:hypothetical protein
MATLETQAVDAIIDNTRRKMLTVGGAALAGLAMASYTSKASAQSTASQTDVDILNFALNLEYLEANYYNLAVYGTTIDKLTSAQGGPISIIGGQAAGSGGTVTTKTSFAPVPFTNGSLALAYATETALEEGKHVTFLQSALGSAAVAMPNLDLYNSFNTLALAAGIGAAFDPFASADNFFVGAFIFEDTGVSAYHGAAGLITDKVNVLAPAVGIHAVEAYHAALVRTSIAAADAANGNLTLTGYTTAIANLRLALSVPGQSATLTVGDTTPYDVGLGVTTVSLEGSTGQYTAATLVDADSSSLSIAQGRNYNQILAIVTAANSGGSTGYSSGLFYPNGLNGNLK